jgi:hypothetical protein
MAQEDGLAQAGSSASSGVLVAAGIEPALPGAPNSAMGRAAGPAVAGARADGGSAEGAIRTIHSSVEVRADEETGLGDLGAHVAYRGEIQSSAGTYGDFTRYLQVMPGVVWNSDVSNDVLVRGGEPSENLYVVDGIEVPNINHLAVEGTSGGFTSMIDTSSISKVDLQAGVYDPQYSSRLSSLIEIETRDRDKVERSGELNLGIAGLGGYWENPLMQRGSVFVSAHRSLLNMATQDIGLNGVPVYTSGMARLEWRPSAADHVSVLSINGADSININPCSGDQFESLTYNTQYAGARSTDGMVWQHIHGPATVSKLTVSYSMQGQDINQQDQWVNGVYQKGVGASSCEAAQLTPVYGERSRDGITSLGYRWSRDFHGWLFSAGETDEMVQLNYAVNQPVGSQSPFNINSAWTDADSFNRTPRTWQTGSYAEITGPFARRWTMMAGLRAETFSLPSARVLEPQVSLGFRISEHQTLNASYRRSAQLAPYMDLLSYAGNGNLRPLQVEQFAVGADLWRMGSATVSLEAYRKNYSNEPVSTEYPSLMLANMVDTLGQEYVWLPLETGGTGRATGLELMLRGRLTDRVRWMNSVTYARTRYAAGDGVMRDGNFDVPLVGNGMLTFRLPWLVELSVRNTYTSGHPYTPYNVPLSLAQQRGIYDLSRVNAVRGPAYNRLDFAVDRNVRMGGKVLNVYGGVQNALNRNNFLGYAWLSRCSGIPQCVQHFNGDPVMEITQMPVFPSAGFRYAF